MFAALEFIASCGHPEEISSEEEAEYGVMTDEDIAALPMPPTTDVALQPHAHEFSPQKHELSAGSRVLAVAVLRVLHLFTH